MNSRHHPTPLFYGRNTTPRFVGVTLAETYDARMRATNPHLCPVFIAPPPLPVWVDEEWDDE